MALPNGVQAERKEALLAALNRVIARDDYREFMRTRGFDARGDGPEEFAAALERHDREFGKILTSDAFQSVRESKYGPMVFPAIIAGLLVGVMGLLFLVRNREPAAAKTQSVLLASILAVAWLAAFVLLMDWLGFVLTAAVLLTLFMQYLGVRLLVAVPASAMVAVLTYQVFAVHLRVSLPPGLLGW